MTQFKPILPKRDPFRAFRPENIQAAITELRNFGTDAMNQLQSYPPPPSKSRYRRTGELGRRWSMSGPARRGDDIVLRVVNDTPYGIWVEGPRTGPGKKQRALFQRIGWLSTTTVKTRVWPSYRQRIAAKLGIRRIAPLELFRPE